MKPFSQFSRRARTCLAITACCGALFAASAGALQAQEVVQQLPDPATEQLNEAMRRLSRNPESVPALIDAGRASISLGDVEAAEGFFNRALAADRDDGRALAGSALVAVRRVDPVRALDLFERAENVGENLDPYAADRGLAFDLVGENAQARQLYGTALSRTENNETVRRLALSHAISGDQDAFEAVLLPLLQRRDLAAYRTRSFGLAILGREDEAITIAETLLPPRLSRRMAPYLRHMPRLTPAQQAAAANLGRFPQTADIGRDDPQLALRASLPQVSQPSGNSDERLIPEGEPLGPAVEEVELTEAEFEEEIWTEELPAIADASGAAPQAVSVQEEAESVETVIASLEDDVPQEGAGQTEQTDILPVPSFSISQDETEIAAAPPPAIVQGEVEDEIEEEISLADAFADFALPDADAPVAAAAGAVDISTIEPEREEEEPEPPPPPAHPSRHWVQVATGRDVSAFRFDWRRLTGQADGALDGREPYRARWNASNRLITGPFASTSEAQQFVTRLGRAGIDAFRFTSAEGEEVIPLN